MNKLRYTAGALASLSLFSLAGCGGGAPVQGQSSNGQRAPYGAPMGNGGQNNGGISNRNKVLLVAGAAALYYMYQKNKNRQGNGAQGQYYRSKNGRVYYRDQNGQPVWVNAPSQPIQVPAGEYEQIFGRSAAQNDGGVIRQAPAGW